MASSTDSSQADLEPKQIIVEIHRLMAHLAAADYQHRTLPEFLELLEDGEEFVTKMREFLGAE